MLKLDELLSGRYPLERINEASANLGLVTLFTMHLLGALPNAGRYLEFSIEGADHYPWQYGLFRHDPYRVENGHVTVSGDPGWGSRSTPTGSPAPGTS